MKIQGRLFWFDPISNKTANNIYDKALCTSIPRMLNLRDVFKLIVHSFNNSSFPEHDFVKKRHKRVFHIGFRFCNEINAKIFQQGFEKRGRNISPVAKKLAEQSILKDKLPDELNKEEYFVVKLSQDDKFFRIENR